MPVISPELAHLIKTAAPKMPKWLVPVAIGATGIGTTAAGTTVGMSVGKKKGQREGLVRGFMTGGQVGYRAGIGRAQNALKQQSAVLGRLSELTREHPEGILLKRGPSGNIGYAVPGRNRRTPSTVTDVKEATKTAASAYNLLASLLPTSIWKMAGIAGAEGPVAKKTTATTPVSRIGGVNFNERGKPILPRPSEDLARRKRENLQLRMHEMSKGPVPLSDAALETREAARHAHWHKAVQQAEKAGKPLAEAHRFAGPSQRLLKILGKIK